MIARRSGKVMNRQETQWPGEGTRASNVQHELGEAVEFEYLPNSVKATPVGLPNLASAYHRHTLSYHNTLRARWPGFRPLVPISLDHSLALQASADVDLVYTLNTSGFCRIAA